MTKGQLFSVAVAVGVGVLVGAGVWVTVGVKDGSAVCVGVAVKVLSGASLGRAPCSGLEVKVGLGMGVVLRTTGALMMPEAANRTIRMIIIRIMPIVMLEHEPRLRRAILGMPLWESAEERRLTMPTGF